MKIKKWLQVLLPIGLAAGSIAIAVPFVVSCSNTSGTTVAKRSFETKVPQARTTRDIKAVSDNKIDETHIFDAKNNPDALRQLEELKKGLSVADLQNDFDRVLTDFYESYEQETNDYDIEIEHIHVSSKNNDNSFNLKVTYEVAETTKPKDIKWTPKFTFLNKTDEADIKHKLNNSTSAEGIDFGDLKEIFFGEKDDDMDADDYGIFDQLRAINRDNNDLASMVAYELSIADIFDQISPRSKSTITKDTPFRIPSISLNGGSVAFVPNKQPKINLPFQSFKKADLDIMFAVDKKVTVESEIQTELDKLFGNGKVNGKDLKVAEIQYFQKTVNTSKEGVYKLRIGYSKTNYPIDDSTRFTCDIFYLKPNDVSQETLPQTYIPTTSNSSVAANTVGLNEKTPAEASALIDEKWIYDNKTKLLTGDLSKFSSSSNVKNINKNITPEDDISLSFDLEAGAWYDKQGPGNQSKTFSITINGLKKNNTNQPVL